MMCRKNKRLSLAIFCSLSATIVGCGESSRNNAVDTSQPTAPHSTTKTINAQFTPRTSNLVIGSKVRLGEKANTGSPYVSNGFSVHPLNNEQQEKVQMMLEKTNAYRRQNGLPPLQYDSRLGAYAYVRADEIRTKYAHERPNGTEFTSGLTVGNGWIGENLDASRETAEAAFNAWANSPDHQANLLSPHFTRIGIAYVYDPNSRYKYHWAQTFASGNLNTPYHFDPAMAGTPLPEMENYLHRKIALQNGRISLTGGEQSTNDNAAQAHRTGALTHNIYNTTRHYRHNGYDAIVQEPAGVFSYQTFGEVVDSDHEPVQYLNIGQPTIPATHANFQATYRGASLGNVNKQSHVYADVTANVNFGHSKTMDLRFTNSQIAHGDIVNNHPQQALSAAPSLNFSERLQWNNRQGQFTGNTATANFYGPNGEEIGGQFTRQVNEGIYQGAFGLQKVQ